jgi:hypothetical protein
MNLLRNLNKYVYQNVKHRGVDDGCCNAEIIRARSPGTL